jgi:hypothetical protein
LLALLCATSFVICGVLALDTPPKGRKQCVFSSITPENRENDNGVRFRGTEHSISIVNGQKYYTLTLSHNGELQVAEDVSRFRAFIVPKPFMDEESIRSYDEYVGSDDDIVVLTLLGDQRSLLDHYEQGVLDAFTDSDKALIRILKRLIEPSAAFLLAKIKCFSIPDSSSDSGSESDSVKAEN